MGRSCRSEDRATSATPSDVESVGDDRFVRAAIRAWATCGDRSYVPIAAFKGLARAALAVVPEDELQFFEDAIEWVGNPDHDLDCRSIGGMDCYLHALPEPLAVSPGSPRPADRGRRCRSRTCSPSSGVGDLVFQVAPCRSASGTRTSKRTAWTVPEVRLAIRGPAGASIESRSNSSSRWPRHGTRSGDLARSLI